MLGLGLGLVLLPGFAVNVGFKDQQMLGGQSSGFGAVMRFFSAFGNHSQASVPHQGGVWGSLGVSQVSLGLLGGET